MKVCMKIYRLVVCLLLAGTSFPVVAQEGLPITIQGNIPFTAEPIYPQNQQSGVTGYFHLSVKPGQTEQIEVRLTNKKDANIIIRMESANGYTNPAGGMMYEHNVVSPDSVITDDTFKIASNIQVKPSVTVPPGKSVLVPIEVKVPNQQTGQLLGGVRFITEGDTQKREQPTAAKGKAEFVLKTETVTAIAVQLDVSTDRVSAFSLGGAGFNSTNGQVYMEMRNDAPNIQENIAGNYQVTNASGKVLFEHKFNPFKMAPKTQIRYAMPWDNPTLTPGNYTVALTADVGGQKITGTKPLSIGNNEVGDYIQRHPPVVPQAQQKGIPTWVWIVAAGAVAGGIMYWLGARKAKKEK